jgi:L-iditol 2-dehydrogenase
VITVIVANLYAPMDLRMEDIPVPTPVKNQVLVKVRASGICGSDINSYTGRTYEGTFPYIPGHEWSGDVQAVGDAVTTLKKGDRVTGETVVGCGVCDKCKEGVNPNFCRNPTIYGFQTKAPGAFAQYVLRDESNLSKLPASLTYDQGALIEPLSVAYHAVWTVAGGVQPIDTVVIFGAGPVGLFALAVVKGSKARAITVDPLEIRRDLALKLGADHVVDPLKQDATAEVLRLTGGHGADLALEASGSDDARSRLFDVVDGASRVVMIGQTQMKKIPIEMEKLVAKGLVVKGNQGSTGMFSRTIEFLEHNPSDLTSMISHRFPLGKAKEAMDLASQRTGSVKVILTD